MERNALGELGSDEFRARVATAVAADRWFFDGASYYGEDLVYPRAQLLLALDYPRRVTVARV